MFVCVWKKVVIILNKKSSLALCSPCQRKSQSGCLSTQKTLPHHSWIQGQSEHVALAWGQQGSATGREVVTDWGGFRILSSHFLWEASPNSCLCFIHSVRVKASKYLVKGRFLNTLQTIGLFSHDQVCKLRGRKGAGNFSYTQKPAVVPLGLGNKMNTGNLFSGWRREKEKEKISGFLCQMVVLTLPKSSWRNSCFSRKVQDPHNSSQMWEILPTCLQPLPGWGLSRVSPPAYSRQTEVLLAACSFMSWQHRKSLPLIWSFEGIKQAALMGGNAALKILPFVCKAFLLLLLGQVQPEDGVCFPGLAPDVRSCNQ